jgi:hypothetical protein
MDMLASVLSTMPLSLIDLFIDYLFPFDTIVVYLPNAIDGNKYGDSLIQLSLPSSHFDDNITTTPHVDVPVTTIPVKRILWPAPPQFVTSMHIDFEWITRPHIIRPLPRLDQVRLYKVSLELTPSRSSLSLSPSPSFLGGTNNSLICVTQKVEHPPSIIAIDGYIHQVGRIEDNEAPMTRNVLSLKLKPSVTTTSSASSSSSSASAVLHSDGDTTRETKMDNENMLSESNPCRMMNDQGWQRGIIPCYTEPRYQSATCLSDDTKWSVSLDHVLSLLIIILLFNCHTCMYVCIGCYM